MLGSSNSQTAASQTASPAFQVPTTAVTGTKTGLGQEEHKKSIAPFVLLGAAILYVVWAVVEKHQKVRESVQPSNIAVNLRSILLITFTAILGLNIAKVAVAKLAAWRVPGAQYLLHFVGNA